MVSAGRLRRKQGWETALATALDDAASGVFTWGGSDCALWVADVVEAMTGVDAAKRLRGQYKTAKGAAGQLARNGGGLAAVVAKLLGDLGAPEVEPLYARRGDVVLVLGVAPGTAIPDALGVCVGDRVAVLSETGVGYVGLAAGGRAWRI